MAESTPTTVYLSGLHSDSDPSPGLGVARSLREAFPGIVLVGVDYSLRSSGLHDPVLDDVVVNPPWNELDLSGYGHWIDGALDAEPRAVWVPGLDVEIHWLRGTSDSPRIIAPSAAALAATSKPLMKVAGALGLDVPRWVWGGEHNWELHRFGRDAGWKLWVKGVFHEAHRVSSYSGLLSALQEAQAHWTVDQVFVQEEVSGLQECFVFAAAQGRLIDVAFVEKRLHTSRGKTWGAAVKRPDQAGRDLVERLVIDTRWHGGGEVEMIRRPDGRRYLIDLNPRFPAYIHGVTLSGLNLPALLLDSVLDLGYRRPLRNVGGQFVRVVSEIPVRSGYSPPRPSVTRGVADLSGKHPSGQPALAQKTNFATTSAPGPPALHPLPPGWQRISQGFFELETPVRVSLPDGLVSNLGAVTEWAKTASHLQVVPALSVKTHPDPWIGEAARTAGWWAECISAKELKWATDVGFRQDHVILNGPRVPGVLEALCGSVGGAFLDSIQGLRNAVPLQEKAEVIGVRLRPQGVDSRFGIALDDFTRFREVCAILRADLSGPWGVHMHVASDVVGRYAWLDMAHRLIEWGATIAEFVGRGPKLVDFGGGWHPGDLEGVPLADLESRIELCLGGVERVVFEPGKALSRSSAALISRVLEVRHRSDSSTDLVVDASIADLPMAPHYAHRIALMRKDGTFLWGKTGGGSVLGGSCMENDRLATRLSFGQSPSVGDRILFFDAGGYDASMAWSFAGGVYRDG